MSLEDHIRHEAYINGLEAGKRASASEARRVRRRSREELRARRKRLALLAVILAVAALTVLLSPTARAAGDGWAVYAAEAAV